MRAAGRAEPAPAHGPDARAAADAPPPETVRYPDPEWETGDPADHGVDPAGLATAAAAAAASDSYCLLVIRHGVLIAEHYFHGATAATTPSSWSIAKSYASTLTGIAIGRGDLPALDTPVAALVPAWAAPPRDQITLRNLVTMTSGLEWSVLRDYVRMATLSRDKSGFALDLAAAEPPGASWVYHNGGVQVLEPVFRAATGATLEDYARAHLWGPTGAAATWARDAQGHPTAYANVLATCRDHARLGYLYLRGGAWQGTQVVPAAWIAEATQPSQPHNRGYGYLLWLNGHAPTISVLGEAHAGPLDDYAPPDMFGAHGFGGQLIEVVPSRDLVIVRMARDPIAMTSADPAAITAALAADWRSDARRAILEPIFAATAP